MRRKIYDNKQRESNEREWRRENGRVKERERRLGKGKKKKGGREREILT